MNDWMEKRREARRPVEEAGGGEEGVSAIVRELPFSCMRVKRNGKYLAKAR